MANSVDNRSHWVRFDVLLNKAKHQTLPELRAFMQAKGLSDGFHATELAYELGFAKRFDGRVLWHLKRYIQMMQADKKVRKCRQQGKPVHPAALRCALMI